MLHAGYIKIPDTYVGYYLVLLSFSISSHSGDRTVTVLVSYCIILVIFFFVILLFACVKTKSRIA